MESVREYGKSENDLITICFKVRFPFANYIQIHLLYVIINNYRS
jgi:hypothetical protein